MKFCAVNLLTIAQLCIIFVYVIYKSEVQLMENNSKRKELTTRQEEILEYIKKYSKENRMPPTVREIGNHFEISSTNGVRSILAALIKKGYINRSPRLSRGIEVVDSGNNESSATIVTCPIRIWPITMVSRRWTE